MNLLQVKASLPSSLKRVPVRAGDDFLTLSNIPYLIIRLPSAATFFKEEGNAISFYLT